MKIGKRQRKIDQRGTWRKARLFYQQRACGCVCVRERARDIKLAHANLGARRGARYFSSPLFGVPTKNALVKLKNIFYLFLISQIKERRFIVIEGFSSLWTQSLGRRLKDERRKTENFFLFVVGVVFFLRVWIHCTSKKNFILHS